MSSEPGFGRALRRLGLALLNATLLLTVLALTLAVVLAVQVRGIARDGRAELRAEITRIEAQLAETRALAAESLAALEARRPPAPGTASPGAIRPADDLPPETAALREALERLADGLAAIDAPAAPAPQADDQTFMRWFVLTFFRFALSRILDGEPSAP